MAVQSEALHLTWHRRAVRAPCAAHQQVSTVARHAAEQGDTPCGDDRRFPARGAWRRLPLRSPTRRTGDVHRIALSVRCCERRHGPAGPRRDGRSAWSAGTRNRCAGGSYNSLSCATDSAGRDPQAPVGATRLLTTAWFLSRRKRCSAGCGRAPGQGAGSACHRGRAWPSRWWCTSRSG